MGEVYDAWDDELAIPVALKTLHLPGSTEEAHKHLKLEGLLARSVWHPNVCRLYDLGRDGEGADAIWFLTMELLQGETLSARLQREGRLPLDRAQRLVTSRWPRGWPRRIKPESSTATSSRPTSCS